MTTDRKNRRQRGAAYQTPAPWMKDGALAWYHPIISEPEREPVTLRGEPWQLGHGQWVIRVEEKAGGLAVEALEVRMPAAEI